MKIEYKILAALRVRRDDLNNLKRTLEVQSKINENFTAIIQIHDIIKKHNETNR